MTEQQSQTTERSQLEWTGMLARQISDWPSEESGEDGRLTVMCVTSGTTLAQIAGQKEARLMRNFQAARSPVERARRIAHLGQTVVDITTEQEAVFAVGYIAAAERSQVGHMVDAQRLTLLTWPLALYLPFIAGPTWVAVAGEEIQRLWREYPRELQRQGINACDAFKRPDRKATSTAVAVCLYTKRGNEETLTSEKGEVSKEEDYWYPDVGGSEVVPMEHIRWGLTLCDFVGQVLRAEYSDEMGAWRERLSARVRQVNLTAVPW